MGGVKKIVIFADVQCILFLMTEGEWVGQRKKIYRRNIGMVPILLIQTKKI